jgi:hypothetical protein
LRDLPVNTTPSKPALSIVGDGAEQQPFAEDRTDAVPPQPPTDHNEPEPKTPWWSRCPVRPLGRLNLEFYFASPAGELISLTGSQLMVRGSLVGLFDGDIDWLVEAFPAFDKDGKPTGNFNMQRSAEWMMRQCAQLPLWDAALPQRDRGVWVRGDATDPTSRILVHCGDEIAVPENGEFTWYAPGFREGGAIYRASSPVAHPADEPASEADAELLIEAFKLWRYEQPAGHIVLLGGIVGGMLGAARHWRAHVLAVSQPGAGKTKLAELCEAVSPVALYTNTFSEPGLRNAITGAALQVILDEAEGDQDERGRGPAELAIEFIRKLSGGQGAKVLKGAPDGGAMRSASTGSAILFAVLPPVLEPQDETRFTRVDLAPLQAGDDVEPVNRAIKDAIRLAPALWSRMIFGRRRFLQNFAVIREQLVEIGCPPRQVDQPGTILAAFATFERDEPIDAVYAKALATSIRWAIKSDKEAAEDNGAQRCWSHLLLSQPDVWGGGNKRTVGQILAGARGSSGDAVAAREHLQSIGLRLARTKTGDILGVYVSNNAGGLLKIFAGTRWRNGKWKDDLRRLPEAVPDCKVRIGGDKPRSTYLPAALLPPVTGSDEDDDPGAPPAPPNLSEQAVPVPKPPF